jgi:hypothetical protein
MSVLQDRLDAVVDLVAVDRDPTHPQIPEVLQIPQDKGTTAVRELPHLVRIRVVAAVVQALLVETVVRVAVVRVALVPPTTSRGASSPTPQAEAVERMERLGAARVAVAVLAARGAMSTLLARMQAQIRDLGEVARVAVLARRVDAARQVS